MQFSKYFLHHMSLNTVNILNKKIGIRTVPAMSNVHTYVGFAMPIYCWIESGTHKVQRQTHRLLSKMCNVALHNKLFLLNSII